MTDYSTDNITVEMNEGIARLIITRPEVHNALDTDTTLDIQRALGALELTSDIDVLVITGEGDEAFSSGADVTQHAGEADEQFQTSRIDGFYRMCAGLRELHAPVIAHINGHCVGGGLGLALYSDIRIAVPDAKFGIPAVELGEIPGGGITYRLLELIGETKTKKLLLTGSLIDGSRAAEMGLVDQVVPEAEIDDQVAETVSSIQSSGSNAVKNTKELINRMAEINDRQTAYDIEKDHWWKQFESDERERLVDEFLNE